MTLDDTGQYVARHEAAGPGLAAVRHDAAETVAGGPLEEEGPGSPRPFRNALIASFGLVLVVMLLLCGYTSAFGNPVPHHIPVAVVAPRAVAAGLASSPALAVHPAGSPAAAQAMVAGRDAYGAIELTGAHAVTVVVASGAGHSVEAVLAQVGQELAARDGLALTVRDIAPTSPRDPSGTVEFYCIVFLTLGGALGATVLGRILGTRRGLPHLMRRLATLLLYSALLAGVATFFADPVYGALVGHAGYLFLTLWGLVLAVSLAASGVAALLGTVGAMVVTLTLTILGNTSAGGPIGRPLLNPFYSHLTPFLPNGAALSVLRGAQYFDGHGIASGVLGLVIWAAAGLALLGVVAVRPGRSPLPAGPSPADPAVAHPAPGMS